MRIAVVDIALTAVTAVQNQRLRWADFPLQTACNVLIAYAFDTGRAVITVSGINIGSIGFGFIEIAINAEAQSILDNRAAQIKADTAGCALFAVLRLIGIQIDLAFKFFRHFFGNNIDHATHRARAVTGRRRTAQDGNGFNLFNRHPVAVAARIAFTAHTDTLGLARINRLAVNQNQSIFRAHTAQVDLAFVATLTCCRIAGQVDTGHGADKFGNIIGCRAFVDVVFRNTRYAERLLQLLLSSNVNGIDFSLFNCFLFSCV